MEHLGYVTYLQNNILLSAVHELGISINGATPMATPKWLVYFMEHPIKMDDLGVPLLQETFNCLSLFVLKSLGSCREWFIRTTTVLNGSMP